MINTNGRVIQSMARGIEILRCFENLEELGVTEISKMMNLHKSTTFSLVSTLQVYGFLEKNESTGKYRLGIELFRMGTKVKSSLRIIAAPYLQQLADLYKETVNLVVRDDTNVVYLEKIESTHSMRICTEVGQRLPLYVTAVGKAILSSLSNAEIDTILDNSNMRRFTKNTVCDKEKLFRIIEIIRSSGYAEDFEELEPGLVCIGTPIKNYMGKAIGAISVSGPVSRMNKEFRLTIKDKLIEVTEEISRKMGYVNNI